MIYYKLTAFMFFCYLGFLGCINEKNKITHKQLLQKDTIKVNDSKHKQKWRQRNHKYSIKQNKQGFETVIRLLSGRQYANNPDFIIDIQKKGAFFFIQVQEYLDKGLVMNENKPRSFMRNINLLPDTTFHFLHQLVNSLPIKTIKNKPLEEGNLYHGMLLRYEFYDKGFYREVSFNKPFPKKIWFLTNEILKVSTFKTEEAKAFKEDFILEFKRRFSKK